MSSLARSQSLSIEDYLRSEDGADIRHKYIDGALYAMTGASRQHGLIVGNLYASLRPLLRGTPCQLFASDMKVRLRLDDQDVKHQDIHKSKITRLALDAGQILSE